MSPSAGPSPPPPSKPPAGAAPAELPPPERCLHNLHRASDRSGGPPEATDLCANGLGAFHMLDCPLFLGRSCAWFEEAPAPHPETSDAEIARRREELLRDFLTWRYRRRVRSLPLPREAHRSPIHVERAPEDDEAEAAEPSVLLRAEFLAAAEVAATVEAAVVEVVVPAALQESSHPEGTAAPAPAAELYPGQRRSEDRGKRKKHRRAPRQLPEIPVESLPPDEAEAEVPPELLADEAPAPPPPPKTVEELFDILPEAKLPDRPAPAERRGARGDRGRPPQRERRGGERGPPRPGPQGFRGPRDPRGGPRRDGRDERRDRSRRDGGPGGGVPAGSRGEPRDGSREGPPPRASSESPSGAPPGPPSAGGPDRGRRRRRRHPRGDRRDGPSGPAPSGPPPSGASSPGPGGPPPA